jgi:hypothetical protein
LAGRLRHGAAANVGHGVAIGFLQTGILLYKAFVAGDWQIGLPPVYLGVGRYWGWIEWHGFSSAIFLIFDLASSCNSPLHFLLIAFLSSTAFPCSLFY